MKKLILSVIAALFLTTTMNAVEKNKVSLELPEYYNHEDLKVSPNDYQIEQWKNYNNKNNKFQGFVNSDLLFEENLVWSYYLSPRNGSSAIIQDPMSGLIFLCVSDILRNAQGDFQDVAQIIFRFQEDGTYIDSVHVPLDDDDIYFGLRPSLGILSNESTPESIYDHEFALFASSIQRIEGQSLPGTDTSFIVVNSPAFGSDPSYVQQKVYEPLDGPNSPSGTMLYDQFYLKSNFNSENDMIYGANYLSTPTNPNTGRPSSLNYPGFWKFDFSIQNPYGAIPEQWWAEEFYRPNNDTDPTSLYGSPIILGNDESGNLYAGVINLFQPVSDTEQLPAFSKSTDRGETWSEFDNMPPSLYLNYAKSINPDYDIAVPSTRYSKWDLVVYGENNFSFIYEITAGIQGEPAEDDSYTLAEVNYNNGNWSIEKIADLAVPQFMENLSFPGGAFNVYDNTPEDVEGNPYRDKVISYDSYGYNVNAALTVDGDKLLVMWIDQNPDHELTFDPIEMQYFISENNYGNMTISSFNSTDVYSCIKDLNTGEWSEVVNLTLDESYDKYFQIPDLISDVTAVPVIYPEAVNFERYSDAVKNNINSELMQLVSGTTKGHYFSVIDATQEPNSVERNELDFNVTLGNVTPNPASDKIDIPLTLDQPADIKIEIFNTLGQKVLHVFDGYKQNGVMTVNADISDLQNGTYYYSLTVQGQKFTKVLNIVR